MHILLNTDGVSSQSSLPSVGQYASHVIREILNTGGVSFQLSLLPVGQWGFAESRKIREIRVL